jgi:hypothetical protein
MNIEFIIFNLKKINFLNSFKNTKYPEVIARGPFTLATPISEMNVFRNTSDLIGNNYSPLAKDLNIKRINNQYSNSSNSN